MNLRFKNTFLIVSCVSAGIVFSAFSPHSPHEGDWTKDTPLSHVLRDLGEPSPLHYSESYTSEEAQRGKEIVLQGQTKGPDGQMSSRVSKYFQCTNCHNVQIEDPDLTRSDPEARLKLAVEKNIPLLPATTFYGIANRVSWYNGDYAKKYGGLVVPARDTLVNAIQLCATECAQGRRMEEWEVRAVLAYYYSIEYKLGDLNLTESDWRLLHDAQEQRSSDLQSKAIQMLRSKFFNASPATFSDPYDRSIRAYGESGNAQNGKQVYEHACQSCHKPIGGVTNFKMDNERITFRFLRRYLKKNNHFSAYYMVRKGTYAVPGYRPYMPNYSLERLSHQQMEDLVAYINERSH